MKNYPETSSAYDEAMGICRSSKPDFEFALGLLKIASADGDSRAKYALATWKLFGNEAVEKDEAAGVNALMELTDSNVAEALFDLAFAYDTGKAGLDRDEEQAFSLYMRAALLGDKESCSQIAQFYDEGRIVAYDAGLASAWNARANCDEKDISPNYRVWL